MPHPAQRLGLIYGILAYLTWGLGPIYFKAVRHIAPEMVLAHRAMWSVFFLLALLAIKKRIPELREVFRSRRSMLTLTGTSVVIAANWYLFIRAVTTGQLLFASLGYFTAPLLSVGFGILFLKERLRPGQAVGLILAAVGVGFFVWQVGSFPWIAVGLAVSSALYALMRKSTTAMPLVGLAIETSILLPIALTMVIADVAGVTGYRTPYTPATWLLLISAVLVTGLPMLWFANAARRLRLSTLGILHYLTPTSHFILAVALYGEPFDRARAITFAFIWLALIIYTVDSWLSYRQQKDLDRAPAPTAAPGAVLTEM